MSDGRSAVAEEHGTAQSQISVHHRRPSLLQLLRQLDEADHELGQALTILHACGVPNPAELPVGLVDRELLAAHRVLLGSDLEIVATCASCGVLNSLPMGPRDVSEYAPRSAWCGPGAGVREPTAADLLELPVDPGAAGEAVLNRCSIGPCSIDTRDITAVDRAEQSLCGDVDFECIECGARIEQFIDVQHAVTFAVATAAASADVEVHLLASRYGWDLATIEALPEARRTRLASLVAGGAA